MQIENQEFQNRLNSATKYPSISTYHELGERGVLKDTLNVAFDAPPIVTEKIDGTNCRIIFLPDNEGFYIGSREELLYFLGDVVLNPTMSIVPNLLGQIPNRHLLPVDQNGKIVTFYGELYGGNVGSAWKEYTKDKAITGFRYFDVSVCEPQILDGTPAEISRWRDGGGQSFVGEAELVASSLPLTPRIATPNLPVVHQEVYDWLKAILPETNCRLVPEAQGRAEGVVVRTPDRKRIAKIRFDDLKQTLRKNGGTL